MQWAHISTQWPTVAPVNQLHNRKNIIAPPIIGGPAGTARRTQPLHGSVDPNYPLVDPNYPSHHQPTGRYNQTYMDRFQRFQKAGGLKTIDVAGVRTLLDKSGGAMTNSGSASDDRSGGEMTNSVLSPRNRVWLHWVLGVVLSTRTSPPLAAPSLFASPALVGPVNCHHHHLNSRQPTATNRPTHLRP